MKRSIAVIIALLALALVFTGCATTSDAGEAEEQGTLSWNPEVTEKASTPDAPAPYTAAPPSTPKQAQKVGLDAIFDGTTNWPVNAGSLPVTMDFADDAALWDEFKVMVQVEETDIDEIEKFLLSWYGKYGWTPEFYAACHNFYFAKASDMLNNAASEEDINLVYKNLDRCFDSCYHGALQYPDRLDLWCGYVHAALMLGDYENAESCIQAIFDRLDFNGNNWYWTYNEPFYEEAEKRENEFVQIIHDYIAEYLDYDTLDYAYSVSLRLAECFPENPIALNDVAISLLYADELEAARPYLEKAMEMDPDDMVVVTNLAYVCEDLGDYETALELSDRMIASGDADYVNRGIMLHAEINQLMNPDK